MIKSLTRQPAASTTERRLADGAANSGRSKTRRVTATQLLLVTVPWPLAR
jgi:hypothetical protein